MEYLELEDLLALVTKLGAGPVRDLGLLASAAARPRASAFGQDAYPTVGLKAAALLQSVCGNHALVDGNKRLALAAAVTFLRLNGHDVSLTQDEAFDLVMGVAEGRLELAEIAAALTGTPGAGE